MKLTSYDRLFPNQDTNAQGRLRHLIALPLQKIPRESGRSVFVDDGLNTTAHYTQLVGVLGFLVAQKRDEQAVRLEVEKSRICRGNCVCVS